VEKPSFVYSTYVRTTPKALWRALTEPEFTRRYWDSSFRSDWSVGSPMTWVQRGVTIADGEQVVLEYDPYRRLSYSWHTMTPELATAVGLSDESGTRPAAEPRSKVSFDSRSSARS